MNLRGALARKRNLLVLLVTIATSGLTIGWKPESPHERAVELLASLSEPQAAGSSPPEEMSLPAKNAALRARLFLPSGNSLGRALVLAHGVHHQGIDEPRFERFATELASLGFSVLAPELSALTQYRIDASSVDGISRAVTYLSERSDLAPSGRVGLFGISFGGGLALVAAQNPDIGRRLEYVTSLGGHHDLHRVLRFFMTNEIDTPSGRQPLDAHEYGVALLVLDRLSELVPAEDRSTLLNSFRLYITEDRAGARAMASTLRTPDARALFDKLEHGRLVELAPVILPLLDQRRAALAALSPRGHLNDIPVPVYLLHGRTDRVIPPSELDWAQSELTGVTTHEALVTPLIEHVNPDRPASILEKLALVEFMAKML